MKKLLFALVLLFSLTSYSQDKVDIINKVNDTIINGYFSVSPDFPKVVVIKTETETLRFDDVVPGDEMDDYYSLYSNDDSFRFDIYECKVIVYTINPDKNQYVKLYNIELK
jgi:hypothetical protein